jgi:hypothetical protein
MAKIIHQEMKPTHSMVQPTPAAPQNYVVEDLSGIQSPASNIDQRLAAFVEQAPRAEERQVPEVKRESFVPEDEKRQLEKIIFMGRHSKVLELAGHKFEISTITHRENYELMARMMSLGEVLDLRVCYLAYAIRKVDDINLKDIEIEGEFGSELEHNIAVVDNMQVALVERLYKNYEDLIKESDSLVYGEAIKNS